MTGLVVLAAVVGALGLGWRLGRRDADARIAGLEAVVEQQRRRADVLHRRLRNRMTPWSPARRPAPPAEAERWDPPDPDDPTFIPADPPGDIPPGEEEPLRPLDDDVRYEPDPGPGLIVPVTRTPWAVPT